MLSALRRPCGVIFCTLTLLVSMSSLRAQSVSKEILRFQFAERPGLPAGAIVPSTTLYTRELGYGWEPGYSSSSPDAPRYFSILLPEGNHKVSITFGDPSSDSANTVKAEMRRLMLEDIRTAPGQYVTRSFIVNIRTPAIPGGRQVKLKQRELDNEMINWDEKLTLEFNGARPRVASMTVEPAPDLPTIYLMGDSTVCDQPHEPWNSWGQMLPRFFNDQIAIANHANSGESLKSSLGARRLDKVLSTIRTGDWLLIQFGHNDMKEKGDGIGAFTSYKSSLKQYISRARERGANVVLITSMERKAGVEKDTLGDYPAAVRQTAQEESLPLIDLNVMSKTLYKAMGPELGRLFQDGTHHNNFGSYELAKCVVEGIRQSKIGLADFIVRDFDGFDPSKPDDFRTFQMAPSTQPTTAPAPLGS